MNYKLIFVLCLVHFVSANKLRSINYYECVNKFCKDLNNKFTTLMNKDLIKSCPDCGDKLIEELNKEEQFDYMNCYSIKNCKFAENITDFYKNEPVYIELNTCYMENCKKSTS